MRQFPASPITALIDGKPRYYLGESMACDLTVADLLGPDGLASLAEVNLGYGTSAGDPALRTLLAARLGIRDDQVLITAGAAGALFLVGLLCGDGEVLVGRPCFPPTFDALRGLGAPVVTVESRFGDGYRIGLDVFAARLSPRTQLVMLASRQNPAGVTITEGEVEQMLAAMSRTCPDALRLLTCASLSKAYGVPGLRVGWLTVPDLGLYEQLRLAKFNSSLTARGAVLAESRGIVERWIKAHTGRLHWLRPEAGAFCCMQLDPGSFGPADIDRFHAHLAGQRTQIAAGYWFGDSAHIIRLGLGYEPADKLELGLDVVSAALEAAPR
jgi:DNA-binding transcriptional MocR family regulator